MSTSVSRQENERIRSLRPPRRPVDLRHPIHVTVEDERRRDGRVSTTLTVFLAGAECPFTCVFCDLWRHTTPNSTPPGAIPAQIRDALKGAPSALGAQIKLYNASNFFDHRAVPEDDDLEILHLVKKFDRVIVECHPKLVGPRCERWAQHLEGRLQVALGLETIHPEALARLNKKADLGDYERAIAILRDFDADWRAFVLIGAPFVPPEESVEWTARSAAWAAENGAAHVTLIPTRGGNGEMERLAEQGLFHRPDLQQIEASFDAAREACRKMLTRPGEDCVVTLDLWDFEDFAPCDACRDQRRERLASINRHGTDVAPQFCPECG